MRKALWLCCAFVFAVTAVSLSGCGGAKSLTPMATTVFLAPDYATRSTETVAVLPFANVTGQPDAEKILGNAIEAQLVNRTDYSFMTVQRVMRKAQASGLSPDLESLRRQWVHQREFKTDISRKLANELNIDVFMVGEITTWNKKDLQPQETGYPQTRVEARVYFMDALTGEKLWEAVGDRVVKGPYYDPSQQEITQYMDEAGIVRGSGGKPVQIVEGPALREVAGEVASDIVMAIPKGPIEVAPVPADSTGEFD